ncbi:cerebellar degeneration-related protein 2-like isoform X2 [Aricia agestis]|uniref:cerebellar degeneration-related protein 2-like isoform X2 n=1 Tax=Aricia agestis TaxID=91739 RepID=UPI001C202378|nr:cerebellar degeneration-related protein 2-like isoform X2 [Aricia agestis]
MSVTKEKSGLREDFGEEEFSARRCMLDDLQLAAELGKTLLERNKELETALRQHQNVIEDQSQEIEYLTKQTVALREVNDSRLRIYEQLEVSIQDLERANHRLAVDHAADKKHIKTLCSTIETLEAKCEDFQKTVDDLNAQLEIVRRRAERKPENEKPKEKELKPATNDETVAKTNSTTPQKSSAPLPELTKEDEDLLRLSDELRENKVAFAQEQRRVTELEEQLASVIQENNRLQEQLRNWHLREDEPKSMHEEFSILEEVRQGQLCIRCLRGIERDDMSSMLDGDDDDRSAISSLILTPSGRQSPRDDQVSSKLVKFDNAKEKLLQGIWANKEDGHDNPYRELVQKYEALLEVQLSQVKTMRKNKTITLPGAQTHAGPLSLQDELQVSADYARFGVKDTDDESGHGEEPKDDRQKKTEPASRKKIIQTPDFSEAETSSSGFSDETSNKATQTERERPGSFLCTIADGEDYRFSIYDDVSPMDSRFRNRPEYRELFKEIFTILKKAAENKDEGERLPLLDDTTAGKVPPVTPATDEPPGTFTDDTQSVLSSVMSEQSIPVSDVTVPEARPQEEKEAEKAETTKPPEKPKKKATVEENGRDELTGAPISDKPQEEKEQEKSKEAEKEAEKERVLTPLVRQPLEYIAATRKKSRHRNRKHSQDRQGADSPVFPSPPKITYQKSSNKKRRDYRPIEVSPLVRTADSEWNGTTLQFYNRSINSPTPSASGRTGKIYQGWNAETDSWDIKQSTASQEIHKLRKLELSYAEVLRNADKTKNRRKKHQ